MLYGNSVLGSLNARAMLRGVGGQGPSSSDNYALSDRIAHGGARGVTPHSANHSASVGLVSCSVCADSAMTDAMTGKHEAEDQKATDGPRDYAVDLRRLPV
jgi:hypothetical protein